MKLCLYQGTFNPPHNGHLQVAKFVTEYFGFEKIIFIPAGNPPHKTLKDNQKLAFHRLNMTKLLVKGYDNFEVSDIEFQKTAPSYTFLTVKELYSKYNLVEKPFFIIGDDAFSKIRTWYHSDELKNLINFIVLPRDNDYNKNDFEQLKSEGYNFQRPDMEKINISSTEIRNLAEKNLPLNQLTTKEVEKYIYDNKLYQNDN